PWWRCSVWSGASAAPRRSIGGPTDDGADAEGSLAVHDTRTHTVTRRPQVGHAKPHEGPPRHLHTPAAFWCETYSVWESLSDDVNCHSARHARADGGASTRYRFCAPISMRAQDEIDPIFVPCDHVAA